MIYITGATGFIGQRLARRLLEDGQPVRCLVRSPERALSLQRMGAELVVGDVTDARAQARGLTGVSLAYHLAAIYDVGVVDRDAMQRVNVEGTRAFLQAAERAGVERVVYVSTTAALGPAGDAPAEPVDAYDGPYPSQYHRTKAEAHRLARAAQQRGMPLIIVAPAFVYGPGDNGPGGRFIADLLERRVPALLKTPAAFSYVHVDDVVSGLVAAGERGRVGETYVLSAADASLNDFAQQVARLANVAAPRWRLPVGLALAGGTVLDTIARLTGLRFPITRETVATSSRHRWLHTHERASRDLAYRPRSLAAGLPETVAWFKKQKGSG